MFIHLNKIIMSHYVGMEPDDIKTKYFGPPGDGTHTNKDGAELNASSLVEGIRAMAECPLNKFLVEKKS